MQRRRELPRIGRRCAVTALVAIPLASALEASPARADLFGDVGVLLAQLEQQLQLVSNAIATVQNLVQTVQHLSHVVENSKILLKRVASGDLQGVLDAAQGFVGMARGVTGRLQGMNRDARWWDTNIRRLIVNEELKQQHVNDMRVALADMDARRLKSTTEVNQSFGNVQKAYDAVQNSSDAVKRSLSTEGVVGQMQLASVQSSNLAIIGATQADMLALLARRNEEELLRLSAIREANRKAVEHDLTGLGETNTSSQANLPFDSENGWDHSPTTVQATIP